MTNLDTANRTELAAFFKELTGRSVGNAKVADVRDMTKKAFARKEANEARAAKEEEERATLKAKREERAAYRASFDSLADWSEANSHDSKEESMLAFKFRFSFLNAKKVADKEVADFTEQMLKDPTYALKWSLSVFESVAKAKVAAEVELMLVAGFDFEEVKEAAVRFLASNARLNQSTSQTSNLVDQAELAAWAKALD